MDESAEKATRPKPASVKSKASKSTGTKTFTYHWGTGDVAEEAQVQGEWHVPTLQLLRYTEGEAAGQTALRFCHYSHRGAFQRSPLLMSTDEIDQMREALRSTPELAALLRRLIEAPE